MSPDPNKKIPRQFQCRESLWQKFEQMAKELECSVDYLINDAMKQYARQRGYAGATASQRSDNVATMTNSIGPSAPLAGSDPLASASGASDTHAAPAAGTTGAYPAQQPGGAPYGLGTTAGGTQQSPRYPTQPQPSAMPTGQGYAASPAPPQARAVPPLPPAPPPAGGPRRAGPPPMPPGSVPGIPSVSRVPGPPPLPSGQPRAPGHQPVPAYSTGSPSLQIRYQGQSFVVNKDKFIIGRGKQTSDLTIKDPNVSRQHAMIEFDGAQYCVVDLGSTNGIEYQGQRIQRKVLNDGDILRICDHELLFSYR